MFNLAYCSLNHVPTPVSSLLHAATLVVAGVVLLIKVADIISIVSLTQLQLIGLISALLGGVLALGQTDIKSVIAYSTLSQFGYIISISSLATVSLAYYHVATHACFKAALFMCAGAVIHSNYDNQDIRRFGALVNKLPVSYAAMLACTASLITVPYLSGNISKDLIIEAHFTQFTNIGNFSFVLGLVASIFTIVYSIKLLVNTFWATYNTNQKTFSHTHEANLYALIPITTLTILAIALGYISFSFIIEANLVNDIFIKIELWLAQFNTVIGLYLFNLVLSVKILPFIGLLLSLPIAVMYYINNVPLIISKVTILDKALFSRLYFDSLNSKLHFGTIQFSYWLANTIDLGFLELIINASNIPSASVNK
ncbi:MAG: hypothetical protein EOP34_01365 [Rickettsiales bacterium]|nr:MAG: hypothetical protein EOP34_01365 [Rickettsiales bacterium]